MLTVKLREANNYGGRETRLKEVVLLMERVLNDPGFKTLIEDFGTEGKRGFYFRRNISGRYIDQPVSNQKVYEIITKGAEVSGNEQEATVDLYLTLINGSDGSVIGYGNAGVKEIFTYSTMFDTLSIPELVNHLTHEWCHKLGFGHSVARNRMRAFSVPYSIGDIAEELAEKYLPQQEINSFNVSVSIRFDNKGGKVVAIHSGISGTVFSKVVLAPDYRNHIFPQVEPGDQIDIYPVLEASAELTISHPTDPLTPCRINTTQEQTFYFE